MRVKKIVLAIVVALGIVGLLVASVLIMRQRLSNLPQDFVPVEVKEKVITVKDKQARDAQLLNSGLREKLPFDSKPFESGYTYGVLTIYFADLYDVFVETYEPLPEFVAKKSNWEKAAQVLSRRATAINAGWAKGVFADGDFDGLYDSKLAKQVNQILGQTYIVNVHRFNYPKSVDARVKSKIENWFVSVNTPEIASGQVDLNVKFDEAKKADESLAYVEYL